ncbi:endonuclease NucS [Methanobacterium aggregans]|uniref:endonuclease NucS n=1 Tax=Methanobacterium aggregans TaxID=1615586 RepID=UPI001AE5A7B1|nr:endonuclease NucS [Methanobacterium aggregans]MBP2046682.1 RecB family endonuclease NucS [Methanobacterium aggregans]
MKFLSEKNPDIQRTFEIINEGISKRAFIVLMACCKVLYQGRARSRLGSGDRFIIIKPDGSFMVHQDRNLEPVNWQPPKSNCKANLKNGILHITGSRRNPPESLEVEIHSTYMASYFIGEDSKELELAGYEENMREMVFESPELIEEGFRPTSREYQTENGFIDILGKDKNGTLMVLELKSRRAGVNAVKQLKKYMDCFMDHKEFVRGMLVAPSVTDDAMELLEEYQLEFKELKPPMELGGGKNLTLDFFSSS